VGNFSAIFRTRTFKNLNGICGSDDKKKTTTIYQTS
jgi:hypothetical protein